MSNELIQRHRRKTAFFRGCMLGGAVGDALGWPIEFYSFCVTRQKYGETGISALIQRANGKAEVTDDTQMTLFTAEGLLRAGWGGRAKGNSYLAALIYQAYLRWLYTQGEPRDQSKDFLYNGWLLQMKELYASRAPGNSCLSALRNGKPGTMAEPVNNSKGCGGVMRVAPIGLYLQKQEAFSLACEAAALTHGHPSGFLSAGVLAYIIAALVEGMGLEAAVKGALDELKNYQGHEECAVAIRKALALTRDSIQPAEAIKLLGEGWVGEEAIAIAIYCALKEKDDFRAAICLAVNHDGDSDSTGAITGNILGTYLGVTEIPEEWIDQVELGEVLIQMADDLLIGYQDTADWRTRYPECG